MYFPDRGCVHTLLTLYVYATVWCCCIWFPSAVGASDGGANHRYRPTAGARPRAPSPPVIERGTAADRHDAQMNRQQRDDDDDDDDDWDEIRSAF